MNPDQLHRQLQAEERAGARFWADGTAAGVAYGKFGIADRAPMESAREVADRADAQFEARWGRRLTDAERQAIVVGAQARRGPAFIGGTSYEIAQALGWSVTTEHSYRAGKGMAVYENGKWVGDPDVVARAERAALVQANMEKAFR